MSTNDTTPAAAAAGEARAPRKREPHYDVFELRQLQEPATQWARALAEGEELKPGEAAAGWEPGMPVFAWVCIAQGVRADNDRDAIRDAVADRDGDKQYGTFWAPLAGTFRPRVRAQQVITTDTWE